MSSHKSGGNTDRIKRSGTLRKMGDNTFDNMLDDSDNSDYYYRGE